MQNLRALLDDVARTDDPNFPPVLREIAELYEQEFPLRARGTWEADLFDGFAALREQPKLLGTPEYIDRYVAAKVQRHHFTLHLPTPLIAQSCDSVTVLGVKYRSSMTTTTMDSRLAICSRDGKDWAPAEVIDILVPFDAQHRPVYEGVFLVVKKYCEIALSDEPFDLWRRYGPSAGRIHLLQLGEAMIVFPDDIVGPLSMTTDICRERGFAKDHALFIPRDPVSSQNLYCMLSADS